MVARGYEVHTSYKNWGRGQQCRTPLGSVWITATIIRFYNTQQTQKAWGAFALGLSQGEEPSSVQSGYIPNLIYIKVLQGKSNYADIIYT